MSETPPPDPAAGKKAETPTVESLTAVLKAKDEELSNLKKAHDGAFGKLRTMESELEELKAQNSTREKDKHTQAGNAEELRKTFDIELKAEREKREAAEKALEEEIVSSGVRKLASKHAADTEEARQDLYDLTRHFFQVGKDSSGKAVLQLKDSVEDPDKFMSSFVSKRPHLAPSSRKGGSGTEGRAGGSGAGETSGITLEDMERMSNAEFAAAARKNPKLAAEYLKRHPR